MEGPIHQRNHDPPAAATYFFRSPTVTTSPFDLSSLAMMLSMISSVLVFSPPATICKVSSILLDFFLISSSSSSLPNDFFVLLLLPMDTLCLKDGRSAVPAASSPSLWPS